MADTSIPIFGNYTYHANLTATDLDVNDTLTWTVLEPRGATIAAIDGHSPLISRLTYTPTSDELGTSKHFKVLVTDDHGARDSLEWDVGFNAGMNHPPVPAATLSPTTVGNSGVTYTWNASTSFTDPDGDPLTFLASGDVTLPDGMVLSAAGAFTWTPTASQEGQHTVAYVVSDGRGGYCPASFTLYVVAPGGPSLDLDVFTDANEDGINDNSATDELAEQNAPSLISSQDDGDATALAVSVRNVAGGSSISFTFNPLAIRLYEDDEGQYPIASGAPLALADLGIAGSGDLLLFAQLQSGITAVVASTNGLIQAQVTGATPTTTQQFKGGASEKAADIKPDEAARHDNVADSSGYGDRGTGGLDDGDGNQELTDRDTFWQEPSEHPDTLVIGFAGHMQSLGYNTRTAKHLGAIWNIDTRTGIYKIGERIHEDHHLPVTLFPEDPGSNHKITGIEYCGDGVLRAQNSYHNQGRVNANGAPTGALDFLIDAVMNHNVTKIALFGDSHGGGCVQLLIEALAGRAEANEVLHTKLIPVTFFYTAYIDAVHIDFDDRGDGNFESTGWFTPEHDVPVETMSYAEYNELGSYAHDNFYQSWLRPRILRDGSPVSGDHLNPARWDNHGRDEETLFQISTEDGSSLSNSLWPRGLDPTNGTNNLGIAEDRFIKTFVERDFFLLARPRGWLIDEL